METDKRVTGFWEYDVIVGSLNDDFKRAVEDKLNDRWQIHGSPFMAGQSFCQVVVKFNPPTLVDCPEGGPV